MYLVIGLSVDMDVVQMLYELKRTIPLRANTVTKTLSTYQVNQAIQTLEKTLSLHEYGIIPPEIADYAQSTWANEAEGIARLH